jgi:DNA mismatch repair protein MutL
VLSPALAQRIAAGEVVERPASVLRELIENALDAGARTVSVELRGAGLELIAVADDGHGIAADELRLAFTRHGTSKIQAADDLEHIASLGFRGEALPSIAAVAAVEVTTATTDEAPGARVLIRDGELLEEGRAARTRGTTVRVRELFAGQPVRRGFLPPARAETALAMSMLRRYALAWPDVRFSLRIEGRDAFRSAGLGEASALAAAYGQAATRLRPFGPFAIHQAQIAGYLGDPGLTRGDREGLVIVVNDRWVQPQRWLAALERAYQPLLPRGRHPVALLRMRCDPARVDVNLHPAKLEIRVVEEEELLAALAMALRGALGRTPPEASLLPMPGEPRQRRLRGRRGALAETPPPYEADAPDYARLRILGQLHGTMIVAEDAAALYLIDQHRADERAIYERLAAGEGSGSQELIEPLHLELRPDQEQLLEAALPELTRRGFRCERFGRRIFLVRAVPSGLPDGAGAALAAALDESAEAPQWQDRLLIAVACHAAVRRDVPLGEERMRALLVALGGCAAQTLCPHGSAIVARVPGRDLARHFAWR